jgi:hypothetical protein
VHVHDRAIRYSRSGAGRAVLLLHDGDPDALWPALVESLATRFRLIVPELPESDAAGTSTLEWLGDFLEGLGTSSVALLATEPFRADALGLALGGAEQVARLLLIVRDEGDAAEPVRLLGTLSSDATVPLLVLSRGIAAADAIPLALSFLNGEESGAPA